MLSLSMYAIFEHYKIYAFKQETYHIQIPIQMCISNREGQFFLRFLDFYIYTYLQSN